MGRANLIAAFVLVLAGLIVVLQNTQHIEARILFMAVTMPLAALVTLTMLVGMAVGIPVALALSGKKSKKTENAHRPGH
ncbi:DUF1049 domain-containing protein [Desulfuromonas sp. TF]|uniref:DUF1049 domain-containing protein n=1 Tax=Desulfuromonas sp. TF TaxID=1232410 RepID=UPI000413AEB4|nr:DUF1049 domain-containing protein [Desulfuromonas sp. TF]